MTGHVKVIVALLSLAGLASTFLPNTFSGETETDLTPELASEIADFLVGCRPGSGCGQAQEKGFQRELTIGDSGFDPTNGWWQIFVVDDVAVKVSDKSGIVKITYYSHEPHEIPSFSTNGMPVDRAKIECQLVSVTPEEARSEARAYISKRYGKEALKGLLNTEAGLVHLGSRVKYSFCWENSVAEDGVVHGMKRFRVSINAQSGHVYQFRYAELDDVASPTISKDRCREILDQELDQRLGVDVTRLALFMEAARDNTKRPVWVVSYTFNSDLLGKTGGSLKIDASTGAVLK